MAEELTDVNAQVINSIFKHIQKEVIARGYMPDVDTFDETQLSEGQRYKAAVDNIKVTKGFDIKVFNQSSARRKAEKKSARFVIYLSRLYDGEIGAPIHAIYANDKTVGGKYKSGFLPLKSSMLVVAIHAISDVDRSFYALNSIIGRVIAQRQYLTYWDATTNTFIPDQWFLAEQTSFNDLDDALEGVFEKVFYYTISDIFQTELNDIVEVTPITSITVSAFDEPQFVKVEPEPEP